jgi:hypothetical protein
MFETSYNMLQLQPQLPEDLIGHFHPCRTLEILLANAFENFGNNIAIEELNTYINEICDKGYIILLDITPGNDHIYKYTKYQIKDSLERPTRDANVLKVCICNEGYLILMKLTTTNEKFLTMLKEKLDFLNS